MENHEKINFKGLYEQIINKKTSIALIGLGYVGIPIAVAFAKKVKVIGYDLNKEKIVRFKNTGKKFEQGICCSI